MNAKQLESDQKAIVHEKNMSETEFLETMSNSDKLIDHEPDTICGMCHHQFLMAQVARDMIAEGEKEDVIRKWSQESDRRWRSSKFVKIWDQSVAENKDPYLVFKELGWET